jgi:hypothetical protein
LKALMLLCDYAEELGGKLYIMGGGWSKIFTPNVPSNMALAIKLSIPWNEANSPHDVTVRIVNEDHEPLRNEEGQDIGLAGKVEVGRPPGLRPGSYLDAPMALTFNGLTLSPGTYVWELLVDGEVLESTAFDVVDPGTAPPR